MTRGRLAEAEAAARKAGADLSPQVDAGLSSSDSDGTTSHEISLAASYEADLRGRLKAGVDSAHQSWLASREALDLATITLSAEVADTWHQLIEQRGQEGLPSEQLQALLLRILERQLELTAKDVERPPVAITPKARPITWKSSTPCGLTRAFSARN